LGLNLEGVSISLGWFSAFFDRQDASRAGMEGPRQEQSKAGDAKALSRRSNTTRSDRNGSNLTVE
jgi:hypothetical protein